MLGRTFGGFGREKFKADGKTGVLGHATSPEHPSAVAGAVMVMV
jgi:hypothetical protein